MVSASIPPNSSPLPVEFCSSGGRTFLENRSLVNLCYTADILVFLVHAGHAIALLGSCPCVVVKSVPLLLRQTWPLPNSPVKVSGRRAAIEGWGVSRW
jgi:hypothetical protein